MPETVAMVGAGLLNTLSAWQKRMSASRRKFLMPANTLCGSLFGGDVSPAAKTLQRARLSFFSLVADMVSSL